MEGTMQDDVPLVVTRCLDYAAKYHGSTEVVSRTVEGPIVRTNYKEVHSRAQAFANALLSMDFRKGDRVATMAWNTHRHLECWYAIMGIGAVCHTLNPRLFHADLEYIINDAQDCIILADISFAKSLEELAPKLPSVRRYIFLTDEGHMPKAPSLRAQCYETVVADWLPRSKGFSWPELDERQGCGLCYTSGTTGRPKGVMYTHRSNVLHAMASATPDGLGGGTSDTMLAVVPMFHANSWGIAFSAPMVGMRLVLPAAALDGRSVYELMAAEEVTVTAGVPTVWLALQAHMEADPARRLERMRVLVIGGSAMPRKLLDFFGDRHGIDVRQMWGMTETSPMGTFGTPVHSGGVEPGPEERAAQRLTQGRPHFLSDLRIVDESGRELPWDGKAFGNLHIRGPVVLQSYFKAGRPAVDADRWFDTGDVATMSPRGFMQITDRAKDVIKSGGEWISSIEIENAAVGHPQVGEAAVIAVPHPKWTERPLLVVVPKPGQNPSKEDILGYLAGKVAKWWVPDDVVFLKEIPHTATGKIYKLALRKQLGGYDFGPASKL
ncbi:Medium-chain-fatty-acid-CoA ligase [Auxenochlorella protothecoides]|uniref:Medium-chain-fatty-acid-CoA ligase n=1 Tax=Auxenochlorella protothecoides TaxID=3075 RepID=A0A087SJH1_AUXPR|nr:Medium-chain-fatty-acid-CoA ligase [Auxenochlorella protothecoides]KFM25875.1 Medium-chain-fatty-acid-CoA ligase [Auxenochlorella protothecoides]RMZ55823.1 hypothetical protein APUTEX25_003789 [Auxenochlorella protothecoides]|eukprot:RMZ55823.1 hypothetical protein APUTEX25_003789 [Auxenochlorella protothecoides]